MLRLLQKILRTGTVTEEYYMSAVPARFRGQLEIADQRCRDCLKCVEICPTQARVFGDLMNPLPDDPLQAFVQKNKVNTLKPYLGTKPRVFYANLDKEVR